MGRLSRNKCTYLTAPTYLPGSACTIAEKRTTKFDSFFEKRSLLRPANQLIRIKNVYLLVQLLLL